MGKIDVCLDILNQAGRVPEAAFLARTYMPSKVSEMVSLWRTDLERVSKRAAESLADPTNYANMFPDLALALQAESLITQRRQKGLLPAAAYPKAKVELDLNLIEEMRKLAERASAVAEPEPEPTEADEEAAAATSACAAPEVESASPEVPADNTVAEEADDAPSTPDKTADEPAADEVDPALEDDIADADLEAEAEALEAEAETTAAGNDDDEFLAEFDGMDDGAAMDEDDFEDFEKEMEGLDDP